MCMFAVFYNPPESACVDRIFEFPEAVARKINSCKLCQRRSSGGGGFDVYLLMFAFAMAASSSSISPITLRTYPVLKT